MEREFKMCEGKQLMMNKGVNAYMKAYEVEENACLENITYEDLERLQRQGLITNGRLACRIDVLGMFFRQEEFTMVDTWGNWTEEKDYSTYPKEKWCDYDYMTAWIREQGYEPKTSIENLITMILLHYE